MNVSQSPFNNITNNMTDANTIRHSKRRKITAVPVDTIDHTSNNDSVYDIDTPSPRIHKLLSPPATTHSTHSTPQRCHSTGTVQNPITLHIDCDSSPVFTQSAKTIWSTQYSATARNWTKPVDSIQHQRTVSSGNMFCLESIDTATLYDGNECTPRSQLLRSNDSTVHNTPNKVIQNKSIAIIHSAKLAMISDMSISAHSNRYRLYHTLLNAYELLNHDNIQIITEQPTTHNDLLEYHTADYINYCKAYSDTNNTDNNVTLDNNMLYGLIDDCNFTGNLYTYMRYVAGSTLTAVQSLIDRTHTIAINFAGGRHHAHSNQASGYCYVNDIVLGILKLLDSGYKRILYIDLDIHHGDGVQHAFEYSQSVYTVSFHHYAAGFYPNTGTLEESVESDRVNCLNIPLAAGTTDTMYYDIFKRIITAVYNSYQPDCIVLCCGADVLAYDPIGTFNLTTHCINQCIQYIMTLTHHTNNTENQSVIPMLVLGGGGYNPIDSSKLWLTLTTTLAQIDINEYIPDNEQLLLYRPDYKIHSTVNPSRINMNKPDDIESMIQEVLHHIQNCNINGMATPNSADKLTEHSDIDRAIE